MSVIEFKLARTKAVAAFVADADPNATPPAEADLFTLPDRVQGGTGDLDVRGHSLYVRFEEPDGTEVPGAECDFTTWVKDEGGARFTSLEGEAGAPSSGLYSSTLTGRLFVQLTAVASIGAATVARVYIAPRASVSGA